jgi:hypothetical protein
MTRTKMTFEDKTYAREMFLQEFMIRTEVYLEFDFHNEQSRITLIKQAHQELKEKLNKVDEEYKALNAGK